MNQRYQSSKYKHLKYTALSFYVAAIILFAIMIITIDNHWWYLFLRGCAGVLALIGLIITIVYIYKINRDYERDKYNHKK